MISSLSWWCPNIFLFAGDLLVIAHHISTFPWNCWTKAKSSFPSLSPRMPCCANWIVSDWRQRLSRDLATSKTWGELWFTQNMWILPAKMVGLTRKMALTREHIQTSLGNNAFQQWKKRGIPTYSEYLVHVYVLGFPHTCSHAKPKWISTQLMLIQWRPYMSDYTPWFPVTG